MKVLIIGLGSIAKKHIKVLKSIDNKVEIFALRSKKTNNFFEGITNIYSWDNIPKGLDFIIISNPPSMHYSTIKKCIKLKVPLFIEKPPLNSVTNSDKLLSLIKKYNVTTYVAFNLRFHPIIQWLKKNLDLKLNKIREVNIYCGSYLPDWRPGIDYRKSYSARKELGGGVHLDLIHEIDYTRWLFGEPLKGLSTLGKKSNLKINSYDYANYLLEYKNFFINIILNYYRRDSKRSIEIIFEDKTIYCNLIDNNIYDLTNNKLIYQEKNYDIIKTYYDQMNYFLKNVLKNKVNMSTLEESLKSLSLCLLKN